MRAVLLGCLLVASCAKKGEHAVPSPPSPAAGARTSERAATVAIVGQVRAHDGSALKAAEIVVRSSDRIEPWAKVALGEDGRFRIEVEPGIYMISISAVDHAQTFEHVLVEREVELGGRLGTYERSEPAEKLLLKVEPLDARGTVLESRKMDATRRAPGVYRLDLSKLPAQAERIRYQIATAGGRTYNGPVADAYESDGGGDYWSIVDVRDESALDLDLSALPPSGKAATLAWTGEPPELAARREYLQRWQPRVGKLRGEMARKDGQIMAPTAEQRAEMRALADEALAEADAAPTADARMLLRLAHLDLFAVHDDDENARVRGTWILDEVDPTDRRLGLFMNIGNHLFRVMATGDAALATRVEEWLARAQENPDAQTALGAMATLLHRADERGDDARVAELYARVREPRFAGTHMAKYLAQRYDPDRILMRGKPFPGFEFPALAPSGRPVTHAEREGRLYLVEFWATWCGPCVAEMPELHAVYAKLNGARPGKGKDGLRRLAPVERPKLEFVFVSLDQSPDDVLAFRKKHWSMPWTHGFVGKEREKDVMARYGFSGVPTAVLVDGTGTIVESGDALRRERLLPTLERALAGRAR